MRKHIRKSAIVFTLVCSVLALLFHFQNCAAPKIGEFAAASTYQLVAPMISITAAPQPLSANNSPTLNFNIIVDPKVSIATIVCELNQTPFPCTTNSATLIGLNDGDYAFRIRATDTSGQISPEASTSFRIDATAPTINVTQAPATLTGSTSAVINFIVTDGLSGVNSIECSADSGSFSPCTPPISLSNLSSGNHDFRIRSTDFAGNQSSISTLSWTIDNSTPSVVIDPITPQVTNLKYKTISFSGNAVQYQCSLDSGLFTPCGSPSTYANLSEGAHVVRIKGVSATGIESATASATWTVDSIAPSPPNLLANIDLKTNLNFVTFQFNATDLGSGISNYTCSLDSSPLDACTSPVIVNNLPDGGHVFKVSTTDLANNASPLTAFSWTIDTVPPQVAIDQPTNGITVSSGSITLSGTASDANGIASVLVGGVNRGSTSWSAPVNLNTGPNVFFVVATDTFGNQSTKSLTIHFSPGPKGGFWDPGLSIGTWRTDFDDPNKGLASAPLTLNSCPYPNTTFDAGPTYTNESGQKVFCDRTSTAYPYSNSSTSAATWPTDRFWVVSANNERSFGPEGTCSQGGPNTGPPNQSKKVYRPRQGVFGLEVKDNKFRLAIDTKYFPNCLDKVKIPFLSIGAQTGRGQGPDPITYLHDSQYATQLKFKATIEDVIPENVSSSGIPHVNLGWLFVEAQWGGVRRWLFIYLFGRYGNDPVDPPQQLRWNWNIAESMWYPGAEIAFMTASDLKALCPSSKIIAYTMSTRVGESKSYSINLNEAFNCISNNRSLKWSTPIPDGPVPITGIHWAIEQAYDRSWTVMTIENLNLAFE